MADPWTEAWEEAETTAPPDVMIYATLELQHPAFQDNGVSFAVRCVTGATSDQTFGIEVGAELNGGEMVTFNAIPFQAERPEFSEGTTPSCKITVDNVAREIVPYLADAVTMRANMIAIYREYRSDDMTAPCYGPVEFVVRNVTITGTQVQGTATIDDLANRKFPKKVYTLTEYPALISETQ